MVLWPTTILKLHCICYVILVTNNTFLYLQARVESGLSSTATENYTDCEEKIGFAIKMVPENFQNDENDAFGSKYSSKKRWIQ